VSGRARDGHDSPEVRGDLGFVRAFRPRLIDMMKGLNACWIARRFPECSPNPHQISGEELNLLAFAKTNRDHLIGNPVCRMQYISGFGQQDKIPNPVAWVERSVAFQHVSERLNGCGGGELAVAQSEPIEQYVLTLSLPDGREIGKIRHGGGDDSQHGPRDGNTCDHYDNNQGS